MKRLLVYLFLVFGLGLIFNINANAKIIYCVNKILPNITEKEYLELKKSTFSSSHLMMQLFSINDTKTQFSNNMFECGPEKGKRFKIVSSNEYNKLLSNFRKFALKVENKKTQIAKKEPKKKEKKISKNNNWRNNLAVEGTETENEDLLCLIKRNKGSTYSYFPVDRTEIYKLQNSKYNWQKILASTNVKYPLTTQEKKELKFCDFKIYKSKNYDSYFSLERLWRSTGGFKGPNFISNKTLSKFVDKNLYAEIIKGSNTQVAKKQKTKDNKTIDYSDGGKYTGETKNGKRHGQGIFTWSNGDKYEGNFKNGKLVGQGTFVFADSGNKYVGNFKDNKFNGSGYFVFAETGDVLVGIYKNGKIIDGDAEVYDSSGKYSKTYVYGNSTFVTQKNEWLKKRKKTLADALEENNLKIKDTETVIVKKEPKKKENKNQKVVKVSEKDQKEIKIKTKELDTEGPKIQIAETITVDESNYSLKGKVSDAGSDKIYLKIDGQDVPLKNGKFNVSRYSPNDEKIKIVAIDKWGNKSTKMIKVIVDIQEETVVKKLEPLNPSIIKAKTTGEKVALIIGIENYTEAPKANYANLDAKYFFDYARKGFGIKKQNINLLVDENATFVKTSKALTLWLKTKIKANQTDLVVFFAGHGLASNDGKELYLLPQDSDPNLLDITALSRTKLFKTIIDLKPKSVTMFLDTCYSGVSRDEQTLLASARPIRIMVDEQEGIPNNFTIFTASQVEQISSGIKEAKHGIFSYYLMKGLEGNADSNNDKKITNGELLAYMDEKVSQKAAELGRPQNPSLAGDPDRVLISYR